MLVNPIRNKAISRLVVGSNPIHGQRSYLDSLGLHYYVARWYDPATAHFAQADTIIPNPGNSGDWDRYAYVLNNPMNFNDPSGHDDEDGDIDDLINQIESIYPNVSIEKYRWTYEELELLFQVLNDYNDIYDLSDISFVFRRRKSIGKGNVAGDRDIGENGSMIITIYDFAWFSPPSTGEADTNFLQLFKSKNFFMGSISHEITHGVIYSNPEILDNWIEKSEGTFFDGQDNPYFSINYDWSFYDDQLAKGKITEHQYNLRVHEELLCMTVATLMYKPWWTGGGFYHLMYQTIE